MHNPKIIKGKHIEVYQLNDFFSDVTKMLLEHFDVPSRSEVFVLGGYIFNSADKMRAMFPEKRLIVYQLEQMMGGPNWYGVSSTIENLKEYDEIWDYDPLNVKFLGWHGVKVDRVVPMLYCESLKNIKNSDEPKNDVLFYGFMNERRWKLMTEIQRKCYNEIEIVWKYGKETNIHISDSKVVFNMHSFEPWNRQEQVRIFYPVINEKTVVSEQSQHNEFKNIIIESETKNITDVLMSVCRSDIWRSFGKLASEEYKRKTDKFMLEFNSAN